MYDDTGFNYRDYRGFKIVRTDPYGFWKVRTIDNKSTVVNEAFTSLSMATRAVDEHLKKDEKKPKKG